MTDSTDFKSADKLDDPNRVTIPLAEPIRREGGDITELTLRKPKPGELRGLEMSDLVSGDINAILALVPRIASPHIGADEAAEMDLGDFAQVTGAVRGFFMTKVEQEAVARFLGVDNRATGIG